MGVGSTVFHFLRVSRKTPECAPALVSQVFGRHGMGGAERDPGPVPGRAQRELKPPEA